MICCSVLLAPAIALRVISATCVAPSQALGSGAVCEPHQSSCHRCSYATSLLGNLLQLAFDSEGIALTSTMGFVRNPVSRASWLPGICMADDCCSQAPP